MKLDEDGRDRLDLAHAECLERIEATERDIVRCLNDGCAWSHPRLIGHRARLEKAMTELATLQRLLGRSGR